ncbi:MAG: hypothetical protein LBN27_03875 [Prevotellaceae bacterium]|jgi:hypothetical protein|nr:hypothetical protein [Prevotellaceae bacterium]
MKKINFILMLMLWQAPSLFAANLPSAGYDGPYSGYDDADYGVLPEELYDASTIGLNLGNGNNGNIFSVMADGQVTVTCTENGDNVTYYPACVPGNLTDPCDIYVYVSLMPNEGGHADVYEQCAGSCTENPELGCQEAPAGAETPLLFFAFSYLAMRLWRRKKLLTE